MATECHGILAVWKWKSWRKKSTTKRRLRLSYIHILYIYIIYYIYYILYIIYIILYIYIIYYIYYIIYIIIWHSWTNPTAYQSTFTMRQNDNKKHDSKVSSTSSNTNPKLDTWDRPFLGFAIGSLSGLETLSLATSWKSSALHPSCPYQGEAPEKIPPTINEKCDPPKKGSRYTRFHKPSQ